MSDKKIKVALLLGGTSPEREVSKSSAKSILQALNNLKYETVLIDPAYGKNQPKNDDDFFAKKDYSELSNKHYIDAMSLPVFDNVDIVFLGLHGKWGEDGIIQSLLELSGIKYTGSKILSSAVSMDKELSKILFQKNNVSTPKWLTINRNRFDLKEVKEQIKNEIGYSCVIKPNDEGSTVGLTICSDESSVDEAIKLAHKFSSKALIEEYIPGRELTVGILENRPLKVLEIKPKHGYYDYECKYEPGMSEYEVPAKIPQDVFIEIQKMGLKAFNALGCSAYARVDFRMNEKNEVYCLEVNTLPGMTSTSLVPKMAKAEGISFEELIDKIIKLSL